MRAFCWSCGNPIAANELVCPVCRGTGRDARETRPRVRGEEVPYALPHPVDALGRWPAGNVVALSGTKGSGKSSLAALLEPDGWASSEQMPAQAADTLDRVLGQERKAIPIWATTTTEDLRAFLDRFDAGLVVVDSLTEFGLHGALEALQLTRAWAHERGERRALVVLQQTKDRQAAGLAELQHLVDAVAHVEGTPEGFRQVRVEKNRAAGLATRLWTFDARGRIVPPSREWRASFSVEGVGGRYSLHAYPLPGARWAGPLDALTQRSALQPGLACAATAVPGYPGGALEPPDVAERRSFAEAQGLRWIGMADALEGAE